MRINIQTQNIELTDHLQKQIKQRLHYIFRHLRRDVQKISLRLHNESDLNRSVTTCCQIQIETRCLPVIYAEHKSSDIYTAVLAAANRAQKNLSRRLNKFNNLLIQLRKLTDKRSKTKTLRLDKQEEKIIGGLS